MLEKLKQTALSEIKVAKEPSDIEGLRVKYLGKKGEVTSMLRNMGSLSPEERPAAGQMINDVRQAVEEALADSGRILAESALAQRLKKESIDVTLPGKFTKAGKKHPLTQVQNEIEELFTSMGYVVAEGPEVEYVKYNFDALNHSPNHPARDLQDTFYFTEDVILRTQTSPVQVRFMENNKPPIRMICPGRVYRCDEVDATHSPMFHQLEGLVVDKGITMSDLKGTLEFAAKQLFGSSTRLRFRPHHFPFTEPSAEVDVSCFICGGSGCRFCKNEGWIEILGAGMVHPNVLKFAGIDPEVYSGFAFGMGMDRIAIIKYDVPDLRLLFENDLRFLSQF